MANKLVNILVGLNANLVNANLVNISKSCRNTYLFISTKSDIAFVVSLVSQFMHQQRKHIYKLLLGLSSI